jgi:integrase/recombinase XerD
MQPLLPFDQATNAGLRPSGETLAEWLELYMIVEGAAGSENTVEAKHRDLQAFLTFFESKTETPLPDQWTRAVSGQFVRYLIHEGRSPLTVNRMLASLRHAASWMAKQRPFLAGHPCKGIDELQTDEPEWKGLTDEEIVRLTKAAKASIVRGQSQFPVRDCAIFLVLLHTGLRISELLWLDLAQWQDQHLHRVRRKGRLVSRQLFLACDARAMLSRYVKEERGDCPGPLFLTKSGNRLDRQNVDASLKRLARQAALDGGGTIEISAHVLRHTMLRKTARKHGVAYAKEVSGHVSDRYIWRYVQPSQAEKEQALEGLYEGCC